MAHKFTNRLIGESSPYLLQHAHNPVDWYPWGSEALDRAKAEEKLILVSIGYSACHWCHVMEHESFEDETVAGFMNEHFVNIKIDREERPDLDHIYMDAVQAISGSGGWPLNVFLSPDAKPFYGGTYFPPQKAHGRASWMDVLAFIFNMWQTKPEEVLKQADVLTEHVRSGNELVKKLAVPTYDDPEEDDMEAVAANILKNADLKLGGFGAAPKFPQTFSIQFLLMYDHLYGDEKAKEHALHSIKQMCRGGINDHLAGGFARYSTDAEWLAPHFEKMLYDNALLLCVLSDAYSITKETFFLNHIQNTIKFLLNEMKDPKGGFYAALDADSEGVEGKFYTWDKKEIVSIVDDAELCCEWFGVTENGNWEGANILHTKFEFSEFAQLNNIEVSVLELKINEWKKALIERRNTRIRPGTDDKILLGWNALLITAFCKCYAVTSIKEYRDEAVALYRFLKEKFRDKNSGFFHTYKNGIVKHAAFLDDLSNMIQACILLQEVTSDQSYLLDAEQITEHVIENFYDEDEGLFYFTSHKQTDVVVRKIEIYDGAVPSGNGMMADNLQYLGLILDKKEWNEMASAMLTKVKPLITAYPSSFGVWASAFIKRVAGIEELVVTGKDIESLKESLLAKYIPNKILQSHTSETDFPLLKGKEYDDGEWIYRCSNYTCEKPVRTTEELNFNKNSNIR